MSRNFQTPSHSASEQSPTPEPVPEQTPDLEYKIPTPEEYQTPTIETKSSAPESTGLDSSMFDLSETFQPIPTWEEFQARRQAERQAAADATTRIEARRARQAEITRRRAEKLRQKEAFINTIKPITAKAAFSLLLVSALAGSLVSFNAFNEQDRGPDNINNQRYEVKYEDNVEAITISGSPNIRPQPSIPTTETASTASLGKAEDDITISVNGLFYADPTYDGNGQWIGLSVENAVDGGLISEDQAKEDKDGVVWLNNNSQNGTSITISKSESNNSGNSDNSDSVNSDDTNSAAATRVAANLAKSNQANGFNPSEVAKS